MHRRRTRAATNKAIWLLAVASALALLSYGALLEVFSSNAFPQSMTTSSHWPALMDKPVGEDGYYMLTVADNIATTGHILYNRGLPATGIQPLATALFATMDAAVRLFGGGAWAFIRAVLAFGVLLLVVFAWQISRITARLSLSGAKQYAATLAFVLTLSSYTLFRLFTYGLETGIYLVLIAAIFQTTLRISERQMTTTADMFSLGTLAGCAGQARIDFGLVFFLLLGILLFRKWITLGKAVITGSLALTVVMPWFWYVHQVSGSWLPTSGKAESTLVSWSTLPVRVGTMLQAMAGETMPWCYGVSSHTSIAVAVMSGLLCLAFVTMRRRYGHILAGLLSSEHAGLWLVPVGALMAVYLVLFNATHFYYRYAAPIAILIIPVVAIALSRSAWVRSHLFVVAVVLWTSFAGWSMGSLHSGHVSSSQVIATGYVHTYYPEEHVGSFQSGVMGFFNRNVENLDGKLNQGALDAASKNQMPSFIDHERIDVLVDWSSILHAKLPATYLAREWQPCPVPIPGGGESICLIRKPPALRTRKQPSVDTYASKLTHSDVFLWASTAESF